MDELRIIQLAVYTDTIVDKMAHMRIALDRRADRAGRLPLARQIQLHIERLIGQRLLGAGTKLPATRELARDLGVNRTTVALAYDELVAAGGRAPTWGRAPSWQTRCPRRRRPAPPRRASTGPASCPRAPRSSRRTRAAVRTGAAARGPRPA